ncbi:MAG: hypothetical protein JNM07_00310 [Phycisphaerae bacterium]|nr:hypothetical protein [Phycisphaerae bacterium]
MHPPARSNPPLRPRRELPTNRARGGDASTPDPARPRALAALARQAQQEPDLDAIGPDLSGLAPRDAAFAHAIYDAAVRHWPLLVHLLSRRLTKPWSILDPGLRGALLGGAAQVLLLDRVPPYAAIDHAVSWVKVAVRPGAGGVANAVLRKIARLRTDEPASKRATYEGGRNELPLSGGGSLVLREPELPEDEHERLALATGHSRWLVERWASAWGWDRARALCLHALGRPPIILNVAHACAPLDAIPTVRVHDRTGRAVFAGTHAELATLLGSRGDLWVQDDASAGAVESAADLRPRLIVDLCAGQGTKTRQLAAIFPSATIVATDTDPRRRTTLARTFEGHARVRVDAPEAVMTARRGQASLVLLDVPCSNTGVLARRPEARTRFRPASLESLVTLQRSILERGAELLDRGDPKAGVLYSTCSLEAAENEHQAAWAASRLGLRVERLRRAWPSGAPGGEARAYSDGAFSALLTPSS